IMLVMTAAALIVWKLYGSINLEKRPVVLPSQKQEISSIYNRYKLKTEKISSDLYYIKIRDIYCDAQADKYGKPHYFKIDMVLEAGGKNQAKDIEKIVKPIAAEVQNIMKNFPASGIDRPTAMEYVRQSVMKRVNTALGYNAVAKVYFESFLSQ
ncbi:MAG: flagellar basal body-associated FliL family protein, partial [Mucispirillum sp.]|nr:flagellar basal body-associated FliL family protein [Mucispirillum sp.]